MTNARTYERHFGTSGWVVIPCAIIMALAILTPTAASAQTFHLIYKFTGESDGQNPEAGLTMDARGNLYGTASLGGNGNGPGTGYGTVYELVHNASGWHFNRLYAFSANDGANPAARVLFGPGGALYGTTQGGGPNGFGAVFSLIPPPEPPRSIQDNHWIETVLYSFMGGSNGAYPYRGDLAFDHTGNIYGATYYGGIGSGNGLGYGVVFELTRSGNSWNDSVLYSFTGGNDGAGPVGVTLQAGDLYGTASYGGLTGNGTVFQLTPSGSGWTENTIFAFQGGNNGGNPQSGAIFDGAGNMYGSTYVNNDLSGGPGTVWELMPSGDSWTFSTLYNFSAPCRDPNGPVNAPLSMDAAGNLYGTTLADGANCAGTVFKLSPSGGGQWTYTSLHDFSGGLDDGSHPSSNVIIDANGNLYGTASLGGNLACITLGCGIVWEITP